MVASLAGFSAPALSSLPLVGAGLAVVLKSSCMGAEGSEGSTAIGETPGGGIDSVGVARSVGREGYQYQVLPDFKRVSLPFTLLIHP